jgi:hypothetical protein
LSFIRGKTGLMPVFINSLFMALLTALTFSGFVSFFDDIDVLLSK